MKAMLFAWIMTAGLMFGQQAVQKLEQQAKVAAYQEWIAQGGEIRGERAGRQWSDKKRGTFGQGPMKGLTMEQARQKFETIWASTPESVKEKYRQRVMSGVLPSQPSSQGGDSAAVAKQLEEIKRQQQQAEAERRMRERQQDIENLHRWSEERR